ncbi:uncharacterized protein SPPG_02062 [Spizellomyces punctatus DAOM BR117]|uniref:Uncharacterized protein n=1 Tax=Spizellomyces punctatus (strain DAOM BR117) TaxID=645134 RepID=A0A0L0HPK2_SPIPD|nr:uncharacterized protein SPPG_02062 [Spizellomyces punctatus DAOM BR117]KND02988.1 hypothetical protein SPPG_02062 [Spizellomyces punctatus DAOM BR117]|eukprot:XP_016611027.1 hypothetical protein SPPG_02062 [Spizellomyces punctatus DAOM BR117]
MDLQTAIDAIIKLDQSRLSGVTSQIPEPGVLRIITSLAAYEQAYVAFSFLRQRLFRRDNLEAAYHEVTLAISQLQSMENNVNLPPTAVLQSLTMWCDVREKMVKVYQTLSSFDFLDEGTCERLAADVNVISKLDLPFMVRTLGQSVHVLGLEVRSMLHLLLAELAIEQYSFKDASFHLFVAHDSLRKWESILIGNLKGNHASGDKKLNCSRELLSFMRRFAFSVANKIAIFFHRIITEKRVHLVPLSPIADGNSDAVGPALHLLAHYRRHTSAFNISLIYLIRPNIPFCAEGYTCSKRTTNEQLTGIQSFPAICSVPSDPPMEHWPNMISILQQELLPATSGNNPTRNDRLSGGYYSNLMTAYFKKSTASTPRSKGKPVHFYDKKVNATYILARVVPRIVVSIIFIGKHEERRGGHTNGFIDKLARQLEHGNVLASIHLR